MQHGSFDPQAWALDLYAAVLDGAPLDPLLRDLAAGLGATRLVMHRMGADRQDAMGYGHLANYNIDPTALVDYATHWIAHDPWVAASQSLASGTYDMRALAPEEAVRRTPFWNEFLRRYDPTLFGMTSFFEHPEEVTGVLSVWREASQGHFAPEALAALRTLAPHIKRACIAEARLGAGAVATATLDGLRDGVAVIGAMGALLHVNPALFAMAGRQDGLALGPAGLLAADADAQQALDALTAQAWAAARGTGLPLGEARVTVPRPSGAAPWLVEALPMPAARDGRFGGVAGAVLLVADADARRPPSERLLAQGFGLTPSEAALAASLLAGVPLAEHARRRRIAMPTARTHLAHLMRKTGTQRQAALVAKLGRLLG